MVPGIQQVVNDINRMNDNGRVNIKIDMWHPRKLLFLLLLRKETPLEMALIMISVTLKIYFPFL